MGNLGQHSPVSPEALFGQANRAILPIDGFTDDTNATPDTPVNISEIIEKFNARFLKDVLP